jgi:hypothetical protein
MATAGLAGFRRYWACARELGEGSFRADPVVVVAGSDEELAGDIGPGPELGEDRLLTRPGVAIVLLLWSAGTVNLRSRD